jgi:hypothetical protein
MGALVALASDRIPDRFKAGLLLPGAVGFLIFMWFAQRIANCPECHASLRERITLLGVLPYPTCQTCGRDLRLSASRAAILAAKAARPPR